MKYIAGLLVAALCLVSCSKDDVIPDSGQYVADLLDVDISLVLDNEKCTGLTVYTRGYLFGHWDAISVAGSYPNYTYQVDDFVIRARFTGVDSFTADVSGVLNTHSVTGNLQSSAEMALDVSGVIFTKQQIFSK